MVRRYTKREKLTAVIAADMTSTLGAAQATGIPESTLRHWLDDPELAHLRDNAREAMAEEVMVAARLALHRLTELIRSGGLESRDYVLATGMLIDKGQLLNGMATSRTEQRDITGTLGDAELAAAIREAEALLSRTPAPATEPPEG